MKSWKLPVVALLSAALLAVPLAGCSEQPASDSAGTDAAFSYSAGIAENGYWEGVTASDIVKLNDDRSIEIPSETHTITDDAVQEQFDSMVSSYSTTNEVTDRAVADGDTVNIDYVGTIDGTEFDGGNTNGAGATVTIGVTTYIDDFLEQLVGHMPGETFDVEVTFPDDYSNADLAGKDAVFSTTINFISETVEPDVTDAFIAEKFSESQGWNTIDEMKAGLKEALEDNAVKEYVSGHVLDVATVDSVPDSLIDYQNNAMLNYYTQMASNYGYTLDEMLNSMKMGTTDDLIEAQADSNKANAEKSLVVQALAEEQGFSPTDDDVKAFFVKNYGSEDYSQYEEQYGLPYLKQVVMSDWALNYLIENATLA